VNECHLGAKKEICQIRVLPSRSERLRRTSTDPAFDERWGFFYFVTLILFHSPAVDNENDVCGKEQKEYLVRH